MTAILPPSYWRVRFGSLTEVETAKVLVVLTAAVDLRRFQKTKRGPKKPPPKRNRGEAGHYDTARMLGAVEELK